MGPQGFVRLLSRVSHGLLTDNITHNINFHVAGAYYKLSLFGAYTAAYRWFAVLCADISTYGCMHHGHMSFIWRVIVVVVAVVTTTTTQQSFAPQCVFGVRDI